MGQHIREYVQGCGVCQRNKGLQRQPAGKLMPLPVPIEAWEVVSMHKTTRLQVPKIQQGHTAISVVVDKLTKTCHLVACRDTANATATAVLLKDSCFRIHVWPSQVIRNRGPNKFTNKFAEVNSH